MATPRTRSRVPRMQVALVHYLDMNRFEIPNQFFLDPGPSPFSVLV